ncbi:hypothetical protein AVEN_43182-1 [Araneus ventricosus]|uniref:Uncharacterized protein n=1 Tax=Araneus ventricosus TaxID=182803 RepID=A0A4Y2F381_ARAVE|nr:hypothetical protein AVEN_43182-1 [Araneus ventricosus]
MPHLLTCTHLTPAEGSTSTWVRSSNISKRILAFLVIIVMVWDLVTSTPMRDVTPAGGVGSGPVMAARTPTSVYDYCRGDHSSLDARLLGRAGVTPL